MKFRMLAAAVSTALLAAEPALAATVAENANVAGSTPVSFVSHGSRVAGNLYVPEGCGAAKRCPAVVVSHPWGGVKEQTAGLYAQRLARRGFVTLAYDATHYGESEGMPRDFEDPADRVDDIRSAVSWLSNRPEVDKDAIGTLGICAGGGYTLHEAQTDPRVKAVATVVAYDIGGAAREGITGSPVTPENRAALLKAVGEELTAIAGGKEPATGALLPEKSEWTDATDAFTREAWSYYRTERGAHPNARNRYVFASFGLHQGYRPLEHMDEIAPRPVLVIAGEKAETRKFSEEAARRGGENVRLVVIPGATHFALYDLPEYFGPALDELSAFFGKSLGGAH